MSMDTIPYRLTDPARFIELGLAVGITFVKMAVVRDGDTGRSVLVTAVKCYTSLPGFFLSYRHPIAESQGVEEVWQGLKLHFEKYGLMTMEGTWTEQDLLGGIDTLDSGG